MHLMTVKQNIDMLANTVLELIDSKPSKESEKRQDITNLMPGLNILRCVRPTELEAALYEPVVCLILQGAKETTLGRRTLRVGAGDSLIVSHDLPVVTRVTEATADSPYLAMIIALDLGILRSLYEQMEGLDLQDKQERHALDFEYASPELVDALARYVALTDKPLEANVMTPLLLREIHFRLLLAAQGGMLRQLIWHDSHASRISRAIQQIRKNFRGPLAIPELAKRVGMSSSSFHQHFKSITATTPLQYQKDLRLLEARRLLQTGQDSIGNIAFEVGYESPTQFSREYARKFGASPRNDLWAV